MHPGKINRISVAVMVNGQTKVDTNGQTVWTPRSDEELASLGELVRSAVGYDEKRGDIVTLKSLEFQPIAQAGSLATASVFSGIAANAMTLFQTLILAIVALALGLFVIRPALKIRALPATAPAGLPAPELDGTPQRTALPPISSDQPAGNTAQVEADPVAHLRQIISERQDETIEVLRNWIESSEEQV